MICENVHRYLEELKNLPDSQKPEEGRHKCCGCAYEKGLEDGKKGNPKNINLDALDDSQAGTGRHKSALDAYKLGYEKGKNSII